MQKEMHSPNSSLIDFALHGLQRCWMPEQCRWSHIYHLDGRDRPNELVPRSDVFYTLSVLVGLSRVGQIPDWIDVKEIFQRNAELLTTLPVRRYAYGTALWAAAELGLELPADVSRHIEGVLSTPDEWKHFHAQDLGMILIGVVSQARHDQGKWEQIAGRLFKFLKQGYCAQSGLFFDTCDGPRRRFSSFATQTYMTLACYCYGDFAGDERAISIANASTRKLIEAQGPNGEWPWFFDSMTGRVLDYYEVYSVHQYGMAPAFLEWAEHYGEPQARDAIIKGFQWVLGSNQMSVPMFVPELHLSIRSQVRMGEIHSKGWRVFRAIRNSVLRLDSQLVAPSNLELRHECRSYELGWILWSFGQREDLPQLTRHDIFSQNRPKDHPKPDGAIRHTAC